MILFNSKPKKPPHPWWDAVHTELGVPVEIRGNYVIPNEREFYTLEDSIVWILPVFSRDATNMAHTLYKVAASLNAMKKVLAPYQIEMQDVEVIFHIPPIMWRHSSTATTLYAQLAPLLAPRCRSVHAWDHLILPLEDHHLPKRCFQRAFVGWERFPILARRQNVALLSERFASIITVRPRGGAVVILSRRLSRGRCWYNVSSLVNALQRVYPASAIRVVDFETLPVLAQASHVASASVLVGVHGAGLARAFMLGRGATLVEVCPGGRMTTNFLCQGRSGWYNNMLREGVAYVGYMPSPEEVIKRFSSMNYSIDVNGAGMGRCLKMAAKSGKRSVTCPQGFPMKRMKLK